MRLGLDDRPNLFRLGELDGTPIEKIVGDPPEGRVLAALRFGPQSLLFGLRVDLFADQIEPSARLVACGVDR